MSRPSNGEGPAPAPTLVVGIDLGTSHTALAWAACTAQAELRQLAISQWVGGRRRGQHVLLPSVLYAPLPGELPGLDSAREVWVTGDYARVRSQETSGRSVASAKSWLCHTGVDRTGPILPWGGDEALGVAKLSPLEASRRILEDLMCAFAEQNPGVELRELAIVLTVPASFDQTARKLTVAAAEQAGLRVRLLEEPQAAFYEYLSGHSRELLALIERHGPSDILVCDIGGGTTDLSLIDVRLGPAGALDFRRTAVGRHLLLGGDNMDLAVARRAQHKLGDIALDAGKFGQLLLAARNAKEVLLERDGPPAHTLRLLGSGADLLGGGLTVELTRSEVQELVLDGFFPVTQPGELPEARRSGLTTFGLPYEREPAITRHIRQFLVRHAAGRMPRGVLLNGGASRPAVVRERLSECLRGWGAGDVELLSSPDPELAVCRGAVRYGLSLNGFGPRIEGGTAEGYYVAVDVAGASSGARQALCVVPRGAKEGERHVVGTQRFELTMGRPARFELYSSDTAAHAPGTLVDLDAEFQALSPLTAEPRLEGVPSDTRVQVQLEGELSAVGTVELGCTLVADLRDEAPRSGAELGPRFSLAFELTPSAPASRATAAARPAQPPARAASGLARARYLAAEEAISRVLGKGRKDVAAREVKDLLRTLERTLGPRRDWDLELNRKLADLVLEGGRARLRSEDHERVFWMLAGYCLRPGFGHALDAQRISQLWPAFGQGVTNRESERVWQQFWIAWRRVAAGLDEGMQSRIRELLDTVLAPAELKLKKPKAFRPLAPSELLELASHLERVEASRRAELGRWLLERTWSDRDPRLWTHIGRIGARVPTYASAHYALSGVIVERWIEQLLRERWSEVATAAASAVSLGRVTGDVVRDVSAKLRGEVVVALKRVGAPEPWQRALIEHVPVTGAEREEQLGDDLPLGLRLIG